MIQHEQTRLPHPASATQDEFCAEATELVDNIVGGWMARNPAAVQFGREQFESAAWMGVLESYEDYDPKRNANVTPFVISRIKWRLFAELNDLVGSQHGAGMRSSLWSSTAAIRKWVRQFAKQHGRAATAKEIQAKFPSTTKGVILSMLHRCGNGPHPTSAPHGQASTFEEGLPASEMDTEADVEKSRMMETVMDWLDANLSERDRQLFITIKIKCMNTDETARKHRLTRQRANQIISLALERMRTDLDKE